MCFTKTLEGWHTRDSCEGYDTFFPFILVRVRLKEAGAAALIDSASAFPIKP